MCKEGAPVGGGTKSLDKLSLDSLYLSKTGYTMKDWATNLEYIPLNHPKQNIL